MKGWKVTVQVCHTNYNIRKDKLQAPTRVIQHQSLQVDTISGATLTANGYLMAIENALLKAE